MPLVSVIVLNCNNGQVTEDCLGSVLKSDYPRFEVILVDNGSDKKEVKRLKRIYGGRVKIFLNKENLGYAVGNNQAAEEAKGKYLVFLNNDTLVSTDWLRKPIQRMEKNEKIAFLQPKIKWLKKRNFFEYAGGAGGYLDFFGYPFCRGRIFGSLEEDIGQYDDEREVLWASGVALFCRKKIFIKLGGFDPLFFGYAEENDLCFRAHRAGYKVLCFPKQEVLHLGGYTSNRDIPQKTFLIHRNHLFLLIKNLKLSELLMILPVRLIMELGAVFYYLFYFKAPQTARGAIRAHASFLINLPRILRNRYQDRIKNFGYPQKPEIVYRGSLVWQYFVLKKERWMEVFKKKSCESELMRIF